MIGKQADVVIGRRYWRQSMLNGNVMRNKVQPDISVTTSLAPRGIGRYATLAILGATTLIAGCSMLPGHSHRPADFAVSYATAKDSISSPTWSKYAVDIDAKGKKTVHRSSHTGDTTNSTQLGTAELDAFYVELRNDGAFGDLADNPPCKGPATGYEDLSFFADGNYFSIPLCSTSEKKQKKIDKVWQDVRPMVGQP
jgi:hypothetical protein